jgi:hypothetical protein
VAAELRRAEARVQGAASRLVGRAETIMALDELIGRGVRGVVTLEGPLGAGVTTLLGKLAVERPYPFWLREPDGANGPPGDQEGLAALCAQLIALHGLEPPLVAPLAARDALVLERLLARAASARAADDPLVVLLDGWGQAAGAASPALFPARLPANTLLVCGQAAGASPPLPADARLRLLESGPALDEAMAELLRSRGCPPAALAALVARCEGSYLYLEIAHGLLARGLLELEQLPNGLEALLMRWWRLAGARPRGPELASLLAISRSALPIELLAALLETQPRPLGALLEAWAPLLQGSPTTGLAPAHTALRSFLLRAAGPLAEQARARLAELAVRQAGPELKPADAIHPALRDQLAEQVARAPARRPQLAPLLVGREWIRARERSNALVQAGADAGWIIQAAAELGSPALLARAALVCGTLSSVARTLDPQAVADTLEAQLAGAANNAERGAALRGVQALVEQLPEGRARARVLRRIGEVCFAHDMRGAAMRLLSQALDMEDQAAPRSWQDERDQALAGLARAALVIGEAAVALEICARIRHTERRGMGETEVVHWLLGSGSLARAEKTADAISAEGMREWALAEVAVAYARSGDRAAARSLLAHSSSPTAITWARTELACDLAVADAKRALASLASLKQPAQRDRAYARIAAVLAAHGRTREGLAAIQRIGDLALRAQALTELAASPGAVADPALSAVLAQVLAQAPRLDDSARPPMVAGIAAALAACGQLDSARRGLQMLADGDERDRALGKVAVALARFAQIAQAELIVGEIVDEDERDWVRGELARLLASAGDWDEAYRQADAAGDSERRDALLGELVVAQARAGHTHAALARSLRIGDQAIRNRALVASAVYFGAAGDRDAATEVLSAISDVDALSRGLSALAEATATQDLAGAQELARRAARPLDQARALAAVARAAENNPPTALPALGQALAIAANQGRAEMLRLLDLVAPTLARLGGRAALEAAALALDEVDDWWRW